MRYRLTIAYDGSGFHGWQEQVPPDGPPLRTVQGVVREALQQVLRQPITLRGASRTDTGVHAMGQVAHFDADDVRVPLERLPMAINSRLPEDVEVRAAEPVADDFDAVTGAIDKQYRYRLWNATERPLGLRRMVHHFWEPLNVAAMNDAAARLVGEHDFAAFTNAGHGRLTTVRKVFRCTVQALPLPTVGGTMPDPQSISEFLKKTRTSDQSEADANNGQEVHIIVRGGGFLYNMVRIIAGTLVEVGRGHWPPEYVDELIRNADRQKSGPTLPPTGLCLEWIRYG